MKSESDRPKATLPDGKRNPAYTAWRKRQKEAEEAPADEPEEVTSAEESAEIAEVEERAAIEATGEIEEPEPEDHASDYIPSENDPEELAAELAELKEEEEILHLPVLCEARNNKFVICSKDRRKVPVRLLKKGTGRNFIKKTIKVRIDRKAYYQAP